MSDVRVFDASALLSLILAEPGAETVKRMLPKAVMSAVNLSEVVLKLSEKGMPTHAIETMMDTLRLRIEPFSVELAYDAASLSSATRSAGLSFADRACLATAIRLGGSAVTADSIWATIADSIDVEIELIR